MMRNTLCLLSLVTLLSCSSKESEAAKDTTETINVTAENFAQAETAWNFTNWAKLGSDNKLVHLRGCGSDRSR